MPPAISPPSLETIDGRQIYSCLPSVPPSNRQQTRSSALGRVNLKESRRKEDINQAGLPGCVSKLCSVVLVVSDLAGCSTVSWIARESPAINHESPQTKNTRGNRRGSAAHKICTTFGVNPRLSHSRSHLVSHKGPRFSPGSLICFARSMASAPLRISAFFFLS